LEVAFVGLIYSDLHGALMAERYTCNVFTYV